MACQRKLVMHWAERMLVILETTLILLIGMPKALCFSADQPEPQNADFKAVQQRLLTFSTPSAVCKSTEASRFRDMDPTHLSELMLVPSSPASRQQMGLKVPAMSRLKPPQLIEHLGFRTEVHAHSAALIAIFLDKPLYLQWLQSRSTWQLPQQGTCDKFA